VSYNISEKLRDRIPSGSASPFPWLPKTLDSQDHGHYNSRWCGGGSQLEGEMGSRVAGMLGSWGRWPPDGGDMTAKPIRVPGRFDLMENRPQKQQQLKRFRNCNTRCPAESPDPSVPIFHIWHTFGTLTHTRRESGLTGHAIRGLNHWPTGLELRYMLYAICYLQLKYVGAAPIDDILKLESIKRAADQRKPKRTARNYDGIGIGMQCEGRTTDFKGITIRKP